MITINCRPSIGDEKGDEKGDASPRHPPIVFDHLWTSQHENSLRNILTFPLMLAITDIFTSPLVLTLNFSANVCINCRPSIIPQFSR